MLKVIGGIIAGMGVLVIAIIAIFINGFKIKKDENGKADVSLFWGAIKVDEKNGKVNILGDMIAVDEKNQTVKVAGMVDVDGKSEVVNISNGDILVQGKEKLVKIRKQIVSTINPDNIILDKTKFNSSMLKNLMKFEVSGEEVKIEGKVVGEDEAYIHVEVKNKEDMKIEIKVGK
jgi:hypothetical protein